MGPLSHVTMKPVYSQTLALSFMMSLCFKIHESGGHLDYIAKQNICTYHKHVLTIEFVLYNIPKSHKRVDFL